jgi:hypothetical protein
MGGLRSAGNAAPLHHLLVGTPATRPEDRAAARDFLAASLRAAEGRTVLLSCEMLAPARRPALEELAGGLRDQGWELRIVLHVRHLLDHAAAMYLERLKQGRLREMRTATLVDFLARYRNRFASEIETMRAVVGAERVHVLSYDEERKDLLGGLLRIMVPGRDLTLGPAPVVNRSPTPAETLVYERLNLEADALRLCQALTDATMNGPAAAPEGGMMTIPDAAFEAFRANHAGVPARINALAFGGRPVVRMCSERLRIGDAAEIPAERAIEAGGGLLAAALRHALQRGAGAPRPRA